MQRLPCLTLFLESGRRFKLPSGVTFDQLRQTQPSSTSSMESVLTDADLHVASPELQAEFRTDGSGRGDGH